MELLKEIYGKLQDDKIKINWNKNPIIMKDFLDFLKISVTRSEKHLGSTNGWTKLENEELNLSIGGGIIRGVEYIDSIQYGKKLSNPYNNYVNPFYLWEILSDDGIDFFKKYYRDEILEMVNGAYEDVKTVQSKLDDSTSFYNKIKHLKV